MITTKRDKWIYIGSLILLAAFLILKVQRGFTVSEEEGGIWNIIQALFVCFGLLACFTLDSSETNNPVIKTYRGFMFTVWVMAFPVVLFTGKMGVSTIFHFITVPYGFLCFLWFYSCGLKNDIRKYSYLLYPTFLVTFVILFTALRSFYFLTDEKGAVADVYYIVGLLPIIFIYTPKRLRILPFLLACVAVMMTGKRTGFLALATIFILYFLPSDPNEQKPFIYRLLALLVLLIPTYYIITRLTGSFDLNMFDRLAKLGEDGGSGRSERWEKVLHAMFYDQSMLPLFVGHGYGSAYKFIGGHVHNDFLEFLYDYGFIVFIIYISFFVSMIRECIIMYKSEFTYAREFGVAVIVSVFLAMFSFYAIDCTHITCCSVCLGLILAEWYKYQNGITHE